MRDPVLAAAALVGAALVGAAGFALADPAFTPLTYGMMPGEAVFSFALADWSDVRVLPEDKGFAVEIAMSEDVAFWVEGVTAETARMGEDAAGFHWSLCGQRLDVPGLTGPITGGRIVIDGGYSEARAHAIRSLLVGDIDCAAFEY